MRLPALSHIASVGVFLAGLLGAAAAHAAPGDLDTGFGNAGRARLVLDGVTVHAGTAQLQRDGKILVAGTALSPDGTERWVVARFLADGKLDTGFGTGGTTLLQPLANASFSRAESIAVLSDGSLRIGGQTCSISIPGHCLNSGGTTADVTVAALTPDGKVDTQFAAFGYYTESGSNGRSAVLVGTVQEPTPVVFNETESTVLLYEALGCCARSPSQLRLRKLTTQNGSPITGFPDTNHPLPFAGAAQISAPTSMLVRPNATFYVGSYPYARLARFDATGQLDSRFGQNGWVALSNGFAAGIQSLTVTPDAGVLAMTADYSNPGTVGLIKLLADGTFDNEFGTSGAKQWDAQGRQVLNAVLDDAGRVNLLARKSSTDPSLVLLRLTSNLEPDTSFGASGVVSVGFDAGYYGPTIYQQNAAAMLRQPDGSLLVLGTSGDGLELARFQTSMEALPPPGATAGGCGTTRNAAFDPTLVALTVLASLALLRRPGRTPS